uniref:Reverse transcriptase Ty1/copia-type domain-containing protein n=1 Tax=Tanacetum cinerariifolium TaxID=118510 RepID=A0A6L2MDL9_TANCI|nr:hypothetical protein [Tanacetum cinerariifolium]
MVQPEGFVDLKHPNKVRNLQCCIYGSRSWNKRFNEEIKKISFTQIPDEPCVYLKASGSNVVFLVLYVDDILLMGNSVTMMQEVKSWLCKCFSMKDLRELAYILRVKIIHDRSKRLIALSQSAYLEKILKKFRMENSKKGYTPMMKNPNYRKSQGAKTPTEQNPGEINWTAVKNILKYLRNTKDMVLMYGEKPEDELKSAKQSTNAMSSIEAEYIVVAKASMEAVWMRNLKGLWRYPLRSSFNILVILGYLDNNFQHNLPPPQSTFESIKQLANQPPPVLDVIDMEPPLPLYLRPLTQPMWSLPNSFVVTVRHRRGQNSILQLRVDVFQQETGEKHPSMLYQAFGFPKKLEQPILLGGREGEDWYPSLRCSRSSSFDCHCESGNRNGGPGRGNRFFWVPSTIESSPLDFANENPSQQLTEGNGIEDQGQEAVAPKVPPLENVMTTGVAPEAGQAERIAATGPRSTIGGKSLAAMRLGMGSTCPVPTSRDTPVDVSDLDPLSFADPSSNGAAVARDLESKNTSFTSMVRSPESIYRSKWGVTNGCLFDAPEACQDPQVSTLQAQVTGEEKLKAAFKEFKQYEDNRVEKRCAEMDACLDALSIDFDEELYRHMLTAIAGSKWVIEHGFCLVVIKCGESIELRQVFADVVSAGIAKGMSEGLKYGIPVYPEVRDPIDPWACKDEILLADAIAANVSRAEKKKKCRVVCRTHGVGFAHHVRSDGVLVSVPTVSPQGLAILLTDAATQTETSVDRASPRLLRSSSLPAMHN